jgi:processive 1,2-diacylglycerol beta-glucosyltransferase
VPISSSHSDHVTTIAHHIHPEAKTGKDRRILVLSVSAGAGHVRAAEALCQSANLLTHVQAQHIDVMGLVSKIFRTVYVDWYLSLVARYPMAWGALYAFMQRADSQSPLQKLRRLVERRSTRRLHAEIALFQPDAIICTHFMPAELLAHLIRQGELHCPVFVQVTDFDLHPLWVHEGMAGYFAANDEVAFRMRAQKIQAQQIAITGIPVMASFTPNGDRTACAQALGLDPNCTTLLLMGGGAGLGNLHQISERLLKFDRPFQLIVMAGKNPALLAVLTQLANANPGRFVAQGFTHEVERIMACADLIITKPGGLTTSECLAMGLPMIINSPIPGQEERNADYLLEQGVALKASDIDTLEYRIHYLLDHPEKLASMRQRALSIGKPLAANAVINHVLELLNQ